MFNPLKSIKDLTNLQQQAQRLQQDLSAEEVIVEQDGIRVVLSGDQQIKEIIIDGVYENRVVAAINEAIKKTQRLAATKLLQFSQQEQQQEQNTSGQ